MQLKEAATRGVPKKKLFFKSFAKFTEKNPVPRSLI